MSYHTIPLLFGLACGTCTAFEVGTHARITDEAYLRSSLNVERLGSNSKLFQLGLFDLNRITGLTFIEFAGATTSDRRQFSYEQFVTQKSLFGGVKSDAWTNYHYRPVGWLTAGAIREDDGTRISQPVAILLEPSTFPEIYGRDNLEDVLQNDTPIGGHFNRFCNHFYDPIRGNTGMSGAEYTDFPACPRDGALGVQSGIAAPAWALALQTGTTIFQAAAELQSRANHFAIADAKEAMWRAATGYDGAMLIKVAATGAERMKYWATTFRSLGGAVHLLQDMAQAQHTRNEGHPAGLRGTYEKYVEWRTANTGKTVIFDRSGDFRTATEQPANPWPNGTWARYEDNIPRFSKYQDYWHAREGGNGLAVYSNRGFLTPDKNIWNTDYPSPPSSPNDRAYSTVTAAETIDGKSVNVTRLQFAVHDSATGADDVIPMTRKRTLDYATQSNPVLRRQWGPDTTIYDAQAGLQLPRAVAYSAGLIDHFFRGSLRIDAPANGLLAYADTSTDNPTDWRFSTTGFRKLKFKVTNTTAAILPPGAAAVDQAISQAKLVAGVKYVRNRCFSANLDLTGEWAAPDQGIANCRDGIVDGQVPVAELLGAERLAMSRECKVDGASASSNVAIAPQQTVDVECNFTEEVIPFAGTDMKLVVAIRGRLGEEDDAVIVQVQDIAEPGWIVYQNHTDYVAIDDRVFPWNDLPAEFDAWALRGCADVPGRVRVLGDGSSVASVQGCARYPIYAKVYPDAQLSTNPIARVMLKPTEFAQLAFLKLKLDNDLTKHPYVRSSCGWFIWREAGTESGIDAVPAPFLPDTPAEWTVAQRDELMFANVSKMRIYSTMSISRVNQMDVNVANPGTFTASAIQTPVKVFRGRGQQRTYSVDMRYGNQESPSGCIAPLSYDVPVANRPRYEGRPGYLANGLYSHLWETDAMYQSLPNAKAGTQKAVSFCENADCTPVP